MAVKCALAINRLNNRITSHKKRIAKRQGKKKATVASAHLIITIAYNILKSRMPYQELGPDYAKQPIKDKEKLMIRYLKKLGYEINQTDQKSA
jgi:transposase